MLQLLLLNSFDNLTSVQNITMDNVNGAVSFAALTTAEAIDIDEDTDAIVMAMVL